jgi:hypothetical protein
MRARLGRVVRKRIRRPVVFTQIPDRSPIQRKRVEPSWTCHHFGRCSFAITKQGAAVHTRDVSAHVRHEHYSASALAYGTVARGRGLLPLLEPLDEKGMRGGGDQISESRKDSGPTDLSAASQVLPERRCQDFAD